jgi:Ca-activated chloride channel homolog
MYTALGRALALALTVLVPAALSAQGSILPSPCFRGDESMRGDLACRPLTQVVRTSSAVKVRLDDGVLHYEITETFVNRGGGLAEADYIYPLPNGAAFQDLKLSINGEMIAGETMSAERARSIYEEIVRRQKDPALVEWMGYGMLHARIFPLNPGEEKRVVVRYETVARREGEALRIDYFRGTSSGPMLRPQRPRPVPILRPTMTIEPEPERLSRERVFFELSYPRNGTYGPAYSPTHDLDVTEMEERRIVRASGAGREVTLLIPVRRSSDASITVLSYAPSGESGFVLLTLSPPERKVRTTPRDVTLVLDVSGSMSGKKMEQARAAGRQVLATLSEDDRFRLIDFSTDVRTFRNEFVQATRANVRAANKYLDELEAQGSTNISAALDEALDVKSPTDRLPVVLFMTDGAPTVGERQPEVIAEHAARERGRARIFTFGLGADVNVSLIEQLALEGRGTAQFVRPEESVEHEVSVVASRLTAPIVTDVRVVSDGVRLSKMLPASSSDIFAGQDLIVLARYTGSGEARIRFEGRTPDGPVTWSTRVSLPARDRSNPFLARLWATQRVGWLSAEKRMHGGSEEIDAEIRDLGEHYGIPTEFTSYLVLEPTVASARPLGDRREVKGRIGGGVSAPPPAREAQFEAAKNAASQRKATSLAAADQMMKLDGSGRESRRIGDHVFVLDSGTWKDTRPREKRETVRVRAYSAAYFALVQQIPELKEVFALGDNVMVVGRTIVIEVGTAAGTERFTEKELQSLGARW